MKDFPEIKPSTIGIWCGVGKPIDVNEFLLPFVNEMNAIARSGVIINGHRLDVGIRSVICDSPARSFVKGFNRYILIYHAKKSALAYLPQLCSVTSTFRHCVL